MPYLLLDSYSIISDEVLDAIIKSKDRVRAESLATIKAKDLLYMERFQSAGMPETRLVSSGFS